MRTEGFGVEGSGFEALEQVLRWAFALRVYILQGLGVLGFEVLVRGCGRGSGMNRL